MNLRQTGCEGMEWIYPVQDWHQWEALVNTVLYLQVT